MSERFEKVKNYLKENKTVYLVGVGGVIVGALGVFLTRGGGVQIVDSMKFTLIQWKSPHTSTTILIPQGNGYGYKVKDTTTGSLYPSQGSAARALGVWPSVVSGHLTGKLDDVNGHVLERIGDYTGNSSR